MTMLIIFLISGVVLAKDSQKTVIKLDVRDTGDSLKSGDIRWSEGICEEIQKANNGFGKFFVEISNDTTVDWKLVDWLESQPQTEAFNFHTLDMTLDAAFNLLRFQNVVRVLKDMELDQSTIRHIPTRSDEVIITIYFEEDKESDSNNSQPTHFSRTDTLFVIYPIKDTAGFKWSLSFGGELISVTEGESILGPALSLEASQESYLLGITGAYRSKGKNDQKFVAGSAVYFPGGNNVGLMIRLLYASESIKTHNAYLQQGFGSAAGLMLRSKMVNFHIAGGFQYFDRYQQNRRLEPTINLGFSIKAKTF